MKTKMKTKELNLFTAEVIKSTQDAIKILNESRQLDPDFITNLITGILDEADFYTYWTIGLLERVKFQYIHETIIHGSLDEDKETLKNQMQ